MDDIGTLGAEKEGPEMIQAHGETTDPRLKISFLVYDCYIILKMFVYDNLVVHQDNILLLMISCILITRFLDNVLPL